MRRASLRVLSVSTASPTLSTTTRFTRSIPQQRWTRNQFLSTTNSDKSNASQQETNKTRSAPKDWSKLATQDLILELEAATASVDKELNPTRRSAAQDTSKLFEDELALRDLSLANTLEPVEAEAILLAARREALESLLERGMDAKKRLEEEEDEKRRYEEAMRILTSPEFMAKSQIAKLEEQEAMARIQRHPADTGSSEVQVAILTKRIFNVTEHLRSAKKDQHSKRGLMAMITARRKHLEYLERTNPDAHDRVVKEFDLRKGAGSGGAERAEVKGARGGVSLLAEANIAERAKLKLQKMQQQQNQQRQALQKQQKQQQKLA